MVKSSRDTVCVYNFCLKIQYSKYICLGIQEYIVITVNIQYKWHNYFICNIFLHTIKTNYIRRTCAVMRIGGMM
jgi:hypothetical protein